MNLHFAFTQSAFSPIPIRNSEEDVFANRRYPQAAEPTQERELLKAQIAEPKSEEILVLNRDTIAVIGENGKRRFDEFKGYPRGWYGGKGHKISRWSVANFERFVKKIPELRLFHPSLFLTLEGNIALGWEDKNGQSLEIEFHPDKVEYLIEDLNEESSVGLAGIFELAEKIRKLLQ